MFNEPRSQPNVERFVHKRTAAGTEIEDFLAPITSASRADRIQTVNQVGVNLLRRFWIPVGERVCKIPATSEVQKDGVYYSGKNQQEFMARIRQKIFPFWNNYAVEVGGTTDQPETLMQTWLQNNGRSGFVFKRTPREIFLQHYLGEGGGCSSYVTVMADVLRAAAVPVKTIFCLKADQGLSEIEAVAAEKEGQLYGHFMGACWLEGPWRLYDFKWQWNPNFSSFYHGCEAGLADPRRREDLSIRYVPVTNSGVYSAVEGIGSENIGFNDPGDLPGGVNTIVRFAKSFLEKR